MRLSYSEQALVSGSGEPVLVSVLQQPRQVPSRAYVEPLRDPRQWHRRLPKILPTQAPAPFHPLARLCERLQKPLPVLVILEDGLPPCLLRPLWRRQVVAPVHQMINRPGILNA